MRNSSALFRAIYPLFAMATDPIPAWLGADKASHGLMAVCYYSVLPDRFLRRLSEQLDFLRPFFDCSSTSYESTDQIFDIYLQNVEKNGWSEASCLTSPRSISGTGASNVISKPADVMFAARGDGQCFNTFAVVMVG